MRRAFLSLEKINIKMLMWAPWKHHALCAPCSLSLLHWEALCVSVSIFMELYSLMGDRTISHYSHQMMINTKKIRIMWFRIGDQGAACESQWTENLRSQGLLSINPALAGPWGWASFTSLNDTRKRLKANKLPFHFNYNWKQGTRIKKPSGTVWSSCDVACIPWT